MGRRFLLGRRPRRSAIAIVVLIAAVVVGAGVVASCMHRPPRAARPHPAPLPTSPSVIRVRLIDAINIVTLSSDGPYRLTLDDRQVASGAGLDAGKLWRDAGVWIFNDRPIGAGALKLQSTRAGGLVGCNGRMYRGELHMGEVASDPAKLTVNNHVPMEHYLAGVLARELLRGWSVETYKTLAVAARTYAMYEITHIGRRRSFDVYADQRSQVYGGVKDETAKSLAAVRATWGFVMTVGPKGAERVFKTYYSSCCGGATTPAGGLEPQGEIVRPLAGGVVCNDCVFSGRYRWPTVRIAHSDAFAALARRYKKIAAMRPLKSVTVSASTPWGRPQWLEVTARDGRVERIRADDLRLALLMSGVPAAKGIYSMSCTLTDTGSELVFSDGRGFGHSVGLCQYGAEGKARRGLKYHEILYAYFPGARITRAY